MAANLTPAISSDPLEVVDVAALDEDEAAYVAAARAVNTLRGCRSDWAEWTSWTASNGYPAMPATPEGISRYLTFLVGHGAKVGTMSRRSSGIRFAHRMRGLSDPTDSARVIAVWEGIRRTHGAPAKQAAPLMPPELWECSNIARRPGHGRPAGGRSPTWLALGTGPCC